MQTDNQPGKSKKPLDKKNGHEFILKTCVIGKTPMIFNFTDGQEQFGRVTQFDNYTVTLMKTAADGTEIGLETYFKHSIKSFSPETACPQ